MADVVMMWIEEKNDCFYVMHKLLGELAMANDYWSAVSFYHNWTRELEIKEEDILEVIGEGTTRESV